MRSMCLERENESDDISERKDDGASVGEWLYVRFIHRHVSVDAELEKKWTDC